MPLSSQVALTTLLGETIRDAAVLRENLDSRKKIKSALGPGRKDPRRRTGEEDSRHEDVRIEDDSHPRRRVARTAFLTSERFMPARLA